MTTQDFNSATPTFSRLCFVVLAHHQPKVFRRLIPAISASNVDVVVHLDERAPLQDYLCPNQPSVHFVAKRRQVHWSGWSLTTTILEALDEALAASDADYFILLAGTDYPIKPLQNLLVFLQQRFPANFMNYYPLVPGIWGYSHIERIRFNDLRASLVDIRNPRSPANPPIGVLMALALRLAEWIFFVALPPRNTRWTNFYSGGARWCLNRDTVAHIVRFYRSQESNKLRAFLKHSASSDEIFFQTVVLNSPYRHQCTGFDEAEAIEIFSGKRRPLPDEKRLNLHYVDWCPEREDPAVMVDSDFESLKESGRYFAYKFIDGRSDSLMDRIDRELLYETSDKSATGIVRECLRTGNG